MTFGGYDATYNVASRGNFTWRMPMVELGSVTYESGVAKETVGSAWTGLDTGYDQRFIRIT